jgi:hypothetical protein
MSGKVVIDKPSDEQLSLAKKLDGEIRHEWKISEKSIAKLGGLLSRMRQEKLWMLIANPETGEVYRRFDDYINAVTGDKVAHTKLYDMLAIHGMMQGPGAVDAKDVEEMGQSKAAEVARLDAKDRTPEIVEAAKTESVRKVKRLVQEKLPPEERKYVLGTYELSGADCVFLGLQSVPGMTRSDVDDLPIEDDAP